MATQELKVKFVTDGLTQVQQDSTTATTAYEKFITQVERARLASQKADEFRARTAEAANRAIDASYQAMSSSAIASVGRLMSQAVADFETIKKSGVASAQEIDVAYRNLGKTLKETNAEMAATRQLQAPPDTFYGARVVSDVPKGFGGISFDRGTLGHRADTAGGASGGDGAPTRTATAIGSRQKALIDAAKQIGMPPLWLAAIMSLESGFDPQKWGGKGGNYFGLIQFGPSERQTYGAYPGQSFEEQALGPVVRYFKDRGFKPGMSLVQAYATVLGGNPYVNPNSSDEFGTSPNSAYTSLSRGYDYQQALKFLGGQAGLVAGGYDQADQNRLFFQQQKAAEDEAQRQRQLIDEARRRADERRQQINQQQAQDLEDRQEQQRLRLERQISNLPDGGTKDALQARLATLDKEFQYQKEILRVKQTIIQLEVERSRKVADQKTGDAPSGDYTSPRNLRRKLDGSSGASGYIGGRDESEAIAFLQKRLKLLQQNEATEKLIIANRFNVKLGQQADEFDQQIDTASKKLDGFKAALADQTPEVREQQAIASATKQYEDMMRSLDDTRAALEEQVKARLELHWSTDREMKQLERLDELYDAVNYLRGVSADLTKVQFEAQEKLNKAQRASGLASLQRQIAEAQAAQLEGHGDLRGANNLRRNAAIAELRAQQAVRIAELRAQQAATKDQSVIDYLDAIIARTQTLNDLQLQQVTQQYDTLYQRISQVSQGIASAVSEGLGNLINGLLEGTKSFGDTVLGVLGGILQQIGQMFLQFALQQLQNQIFKSLFGLIGGAFGGGFGGGGGGGGLGGIGNLFGFAGFAEGGPVYGPGTETSDSIPVRLSRGEFVTRASAVRTVGPEFMHRINAAKSLTEAHQAMAAELMGMAAGGLAEEMFEAAGQDIYRQVTLGAVDLGRSPSVRRGGAIVANINITTPNPDGFKPSERQIGQKVLDQVKRGMSRG